MKELPSQLVAEMPGQMGSDTSPDTRTLKDCVRQALTEYFQQVDGEEVSNLYEMVLSEVEAPLLEVVLEISRSNQSRAAQILGLNRGTLRKKLKQHNLLQEKPFP